MARSISKADDPPLEFLIGRDHRGNWLVVELHGLAGGFFASKDAALRYAASEVHGSTATIRVAPGPIDPFARLL